MKKNHKQIYLKNLNSFFIASKKGICIFQFKKEDLLDYNLISSFLTGLDDVFGDGLKNEHLQNLTIGNNDEKIFLHITYDNKANLYFIGLLDNQKKKDKALEELEQLKKAFLKFCSNNNIKRYVDESNIYDDFQRRLCFFEDKNSISMMKNL